MATADNGEIQLKSSQGVINVEAADGDINLLTAGGSINATCLQGFNITGDLNIAGSIEATGDISDSVRSMNQDRALYNGHTHSANGASPPVPQQ